MKATVTQATARRCGGLRAAVACPSSPSLRRASERCRFSRTRPRTSAPPSPFLGGNEGRRGLAVVRATEPGKPPEEPEGDLGILPNTGRYFLYFISVLTGTAYVAFRPVFKFMKDSPLKVLLVLGISVLSYEFVSFVVQAMLGVNGDPFGGPVRGGNGGF